MDFSPNAISIFVTTALTDRFQTPEDIKKKKAAKKEKKAAKAAAKAALNGKPVKAKKGAIEPAAPATEAPAADVEAAPQPTGVETEPEAGSVSQRPPRATVEEAEDE